MLFIIFYNRYLILIDTVWLLNSLPRKDPPIFENGKPSISMGHLYHGELLNNQMVHSEWSNIEPGLTRNRLQKPYGPRFHAVFFRVSTLPLRLTRQVSIRWTSGFAWTGMPMNLRRLLVIKSIEKTGPFAGVFWTTTIFLIFPQKSNFLGIKRSISPHSDLFPHAFLGEFVGAGSWPEHPRLERKQNVFFLGGIPSGNFTKLLNMAIETVNIAIWNMVIFQSHVSLLEGKIDILLVPYLFFFADWPTMNSAQSSRVQVPNVSEVFFVYFMGICFQIAFFFLIKAAIKFYIIAAGSMVLTVVQGAASVR